jgi:hypothetical protein
VFQLSLLVQSFYSLFFPDDFVNVDGQDTYFLYTIEDTISSLNRTVTTVGLCSLVCPHPHPTPSLLSPLSLPHQCVVPCIVL